VFVPRLVKIAEGKVTEMMDLYWTGWFSEPI